MLISAMKADHVGSNVEQDKVDALRSVVGWDFVASRARTAEDVEELMEAKIDIDAPGFPSKPEKLEALTTSTFHQRGSDCSKP